jgi:hypothetical protein
MPNLSVMLIMVRAHIAALMYFWGHWLWCKAGEVSPELYEVVREELLRKEKLYALYQAQRPD